MMRAAPPSASSTAPPSPTSSGQAGAEGDDWLEVGPRQRAAITRNSGHSNISSPIEKEAKELLGILLVATLKRKSQLALVQNTTLTLYSTVLHTLMLANRGSFLMAS